MIQEILTELDPTIFQVSEPVDLTQPDVTVATTITDMLDTVLSVKGFGISAPQIGVNKRVIVVLNQKTKAYEVYINPKIIQRSSAKATVSEMSFSRPNKMANMRRNKAITVEAYDMNMERVTIKAKKGYAAIFQHQIDMLDGILIGSKGEIRAFSVGSEDSE